MCAPVRGRTLSTVGAVRWERHVVVDATLSHPVDAVFPYLADPTKWHDFAPAVVYREQIDAASCALAWYSAVVYVPGMSA